MAQNQHRGRPSGYRPEACQVAERGATQPEIADELGVTNRTLSRWARKFPEFRSALDRGLVLREAERRYAETAPLRAAAAEILRIVAEARARSGACEGPLADSGRNVSTSDRGLKSAPTSTLQDNLAMARRERISTRYQPVADEQDPSQGEPVELLDPRSAW